jgi:hypothetical protein
MEINRNSSKEKSFNFFLPIAFILSIIPLIVRMAIVNVDETTAKLWGTATQTDLFSQQKAFFLMCFSILLVIISIIFFKKIFSKKDKVINYILISSCVFFIFTLFSAIFSKYREVSFGGIFDRAEGLITIACYLVLFIYSIYTFKTTNNYKYIITPIFILVSINAFLGIFQFIGQDLINTPLGKSIVLPSEYLNGKTQLNLSNGTSIYGTLFNSNYVGSFTAITLPLFFCLTIFEDDVMNKIMYFFGTIFSVWLLLGSNSRAGIIGVIFATIFGIVLFWKLIFQRWKGILISILCLLILAVGFNLISKGALLLKVTSLAEDISIVFKDTNNFDYKEHTPVRDIIHTDKDVEIILPNETLKISYENNDFVFKNSKNAIVPYTKAGKVYTTTDEAFKNISFGFGKFLKTSTTTDALLLQIDSQPFFMFRLNDKKLLHLVDLNSKEYIDLGNVETFGFKGKERIGSARGYIWSRSIPLLKQNVILGGGPDTFAFNFPQNDLIAKWYALGTPNMVVDKPHNLYLQMGLNSGLVALLAFISIMTIYLVDSFKLYAFKEYYEKPQIIGAVNTLAIVGYLFAGMFNDSVVSVAPIFWIVLGVGVALNYINRKASKKTITAPSK